MHCNCFCYLNDYMLSNYAVKLKKVIVANYGTPEERKTKAGASRGKIKKLNFLKKAKTKAKPKIQKRIEKGFAELNKELEK